MPIRFRSRHTDLRHRRPKAALFESESTTEALVRAAPGIPSSVRYVLDRDQAITEAYRTCARTLTEIAKHFGIHQSTASRIGLHDEYV